MEHIVSEQSATSKITLRERFLGYAEMIDAFRVVPRFLLSMYGVLVYTLYTWYTSIETVVQETCDAALVKILIDHGESIAAAQELACSVSSVTGGPTTAQTTFVTTVIGLATPLFAFYANTGRDWGKGKSE